MAKRLPANGGLRLGDGDAVRSYLENAQAAENNCENQLRAFARHGDDDEVQGIFASHADQARVRSERLKLRTGESGGKPSGIFHSAPKLAQSAHVAEEQTLQDLVAAYSIHRGICALYEALSAVTQVSRDEATRNLAVQFQAEQAQAAQNVWRFLCSRSKIAYNVLTAGERDPAIETRATENRVR